MFLTKVEKIRTHFMFSDLFSLENRAFYEIMWNNVIEPDRPRMTIFIAYWIPKATNTHLEYVILTAFLLKQWLHERPAL